MRCAASVLHLALGKAQRDLGIDLAASDVCEFSAHGPYVRHLRRYARSVANSEYFADEPPGSQLDGVRCEDMQRLTYADASFDLVTHTEVLEHVADDLMALSELRRVLRPRGVMLFTVPLHDGETTIERARWCNGVLEYLLTPVYHEDPLQRGGILAYRDYGRDILRRLSLAGFDRSSFYLTDFLVSWITPRRVIVAGPAEIQCSRIQE